MATEGVGKRPLFQDLGAQIDLDELEVSELQSLCMNCHKQGTTKIMLTMIPMFREVILSSFHCPHCGESNTAIQPGGPVQEEGARYTLTVKDTKCLNLMMVKADSAVVSIPELEFEAPACRGQITTVESILQEAIANLGQEQSYRMATQPEVGKQLELFIAKLRDCLQVNSPFTVILDDPSGNSFLQSDSCLRVDRYKRSPEQVQHLALAADPEDIEESADDRDATTSPVGTDEVVTFQNNCPNCHSPVETRMKLTDVPNFKQVVIMATNCEYCGHRSNDVKPGAGVSEFGTKITLKLTEVSDLSRDLLKADTAMLLIPELEFEAGCGTLGGCFTTVEGLLVQSRDQLKNSNPFFLGDSGGGGDGDKLLAFIEEMNKIISGKRLGVHMVLDDPAGNSYIQNVHAPDTDPHMIVENYKRSFEQNEVLGLNDMKTENYTSST